MTKYGRHLYIVRNLYFLNSGKVICGKEQRGWKKMLNRRVSKLLLAYNPKPDPNVIAHPLYKEYCEDDTILDTLFFMCCGTGIVAGAVSNMDYEDLPPKIMGAVVGGCYGAICGGVPIIGIGLITYHCYTKQMPPLRISQTGDNEWSWKNKQ